MTSNADKLLNAQAEFLPSRVDDAISLPCAELLGAQVYVYAERGKLRVSIDLDTADESLIGDDAERLVRLRVCLGDSIILDTDDQGVITHGDLVDRSVREPQDYGHGSSAAGCAGTLSECAHNTPPYTGPPGTPNRMPA